MQSGSEKTRKLAPICGCSTGVGGREKYRHQIPSASLTEGRYAMPTKIIDGFEIEFTAELLLGCEFWGAYVAIYEGSENPMHLKIIYPKRRVAADVDFPDEDSAKSAAEKGGMEALQRLRQLASPAGLPK